MTAFGPEHTPFDAIGGEPRVRSLVDRFYDAMDREAAYATIRAMHQPDLAEARDKLFWFLCGWMGGPAHYVERFGHPRLRGRHTPFPIDETARDQWLACMAEALDAEEVTGALRTFLDGRFAHVADFMRNR